MPRRVTPVSAPPPNQTSVRDAGGRPTDPLILALEGTLEGLVACSDDRAVIVEGLTYLSRLGHEMGLLFRRAQYPAAGHPMTGSRYSALADLHRRAVEHLRARADRLTLAVLPELRSIAGTVDAAIAQRKVAAV